MVLRATVCSLIIRELSYFTINFAKNESWMELSTMVLCKVPDLKVRSSAVMFTVKIFLIQIASPEKML